MGSPTTLSLSNVAPSVTFTETGSAVTLSPAVAITDPNSTTLASATVEITGGTFSGDGDVLAATPTGNITVSYNSATETLTLTGSDTLADYEQVLDSVTFDASGNPTLSGAHPARTLTWTVNDGSATGSATSAIGITAAPNVVLFNGTDADGYQNLWVTNGTAAGTSELSVAGADSSGLDPTGFTVFGSEVVFAGYDTSRGDNLWVTNGTAAGTSELSVAGPSPLNPQYLTVFGSEVVFAGYDTGGDDNLWVTNGTAAGTSDLSVAGAESGGLFPPGGLVPDFTVFGSEVLFDGADTSRNHNLWVTNGTAAGTSEISVAGADSEGLFGPFNQYSNPDFTVFGSEVVFDGVDASGDQNLWVTNGTAAGTSELSVAGTYSGGLFIDSPNFTPDFTVFGSEVLFHGIDAGGNVDLWVTNGTAAGTSELSVAADLGGLNPGPLVVFGSEVLFAGYDTSGNVDLWVTNGTAAGTSELSVAGANSQGLDPSNFAVFGSEVLFEGTDPSADYGHLWVTNGTAAGTSELSVAGAFSEGLFRHVTPQFAVFGSEVVFEGEDASGHYGLWVTNGTAAGTSELSVAGANSSEGLGPTEFTPFAQPIFTLGNVATSVTFTETGSAVTLSPSVTVTDTNSTTLVSATVAITGGTFAGDGDVLAATTTGTSITASYNAATETLVLTGSDTLADYEQVLDTVTFDATGNPTADGAHPTRTLTWTVNDAGAATSTTSTVAITAAPNVVLFAGEDTSGAFNLWVTNGTAAGTSELSVAGAYQGDLSPQNLTVFGSELLFEGTDANDARNLWVTNGTAAGTSEISVAGAYSAGLSPQNLTVFGSEVLFEGQGASDGRNLWVTNGTVAGTSELSVAGAWSEGLQPSNFTIFGSEVLFAGKDASGNPNLWVTNGTAAGTSELSVAGADSAGLFNLAENPEFTVFGSEVLFQGYDSDGYQNLWVTNGTLAGTSELSVAGAYSEGLSPRFLTVLGSEVLFAGYDTGGAANLWVTNGTVSGTSELTVTGANPGFSPQYLTVFGSEVLFSGEDASGHPDLWVTNGTAAGTSEISVTGAYSQGLAPSEFAVFGSEVLFSGLDSSFKQNLWVTNGTAAGTSEISVAGAYSEGLFFAVQPDFTVIGSEVLFEGQDASNHFNLWVTNGTVAGTSELTVAGAYSEGFNPTDLTPFAEPILLSNVATSVAFTQDGNAVTLSPSVAVTDSNSTTLASATVAITGGAFAGDVLGFSTAGTSITASYNSSTETLTLTGSDTLSDYQQVLDTVTFNSTSLNPTDYGSDPTRTVTWTVNDGFGSATASSTIDITAVNQPPTLSNVAGSVTFTETGGAVSLSPSAAVTDPDRLDLVSATVAIVGGTFAGDGDVLAFSTAGTSITASYNSSTETLTLTGSDTLAHYQQVLDTVTFDATGNPTADGAYPTRTLTWTVNDGSVTSSITTTVAITAAPDVVLFDGRDASNQFGLWVTNGTAAGTSELSVAGAYSGGLFASPAVPNFFVFGSEVLFQA
jgi:ELWxxDGT repeat protein